MLPAEPGSSGDASADEQLSALREAVFQQYKAVCGLHGLLLKDIISVSIWQKNPANRDSGNSIKKFLDEYNNMLFSAPESLWDEEAFKHNLQTCQDAKLVELKHGYYEAHKQLNECRECLDQLMSDLGVVKAVDKSNEVDLNDPDMQAVLKIIKRKGVRPPSPPLLSATSGCLPDGVKEHAKILTGQKNKTRMDWNKLTLSLSAAGKVPEEKWSLFCCWPSRGKKYSKEGQGLRDPLLAQAAEPAPAAGTAPKEELSLFCCWPLIGRKDSKERQGSREPLLEQAAAATEEPSPSSTRNKWGCCCWMKFKRETPAVEPAPAHQHTSTLTPS